MSDYTTVRSGRASLVNRETVEEPQNARTGGGNKITLRNLIDNSLSFLRNFFGDSCSVCNGTGVYPGTGQVTCDYCKGTGEVVSQ